MTQTADNNNLQLETEVGHDPQFSSQTVDNNNRQSKTEVGYDPQILLLERQLETKQIQKKEELENSKQIEVRLSKVYKAIETASSENLHADTQHELSVLLRLVPNIRKKNNLDILTQFETAVSILLKTSSPKNNSTKVFSDNSNLSGDSDGNEKNKKNCLPNNFIFAKKLRKSIQYQVSSQSSKSTYLIGGLATFLGIVGALPLFFVASQPPTVTVTPESISELKITASAPIRVVKSGTGVEAKEETPEEVTSEEVRRDENSDGVSVYTIEFIDDEEFKNIIKNQTASLNEEIGTQLFSNFEDNIDNIVADIILKLQTDNPEDSKTNEITNERLISALKSVFSEPELQRRLTVDKELIDKTLEETGLVNFNNGEGNSSTNNSQSSSDLDVTLKELGIEWRALLIVIAGGAFGASTFIVIKAQNINTFINEDPWTLFFTGLLKPISGVALAVFLFAALESNALPLSLQTSTTDNNTDTKTYLFFTIAFVAGFSQLLVQDLISKTEGTVIGSSSDKTEVKSSL